MGISGHIMVTLVYGSLELEVLFLDYSGIVKIKLTRFDFLQNKRDNFKLFNVFFVYIAW